MPATKFKYPPKTLDHELSFGKYKSDPLWHVIETDPSYITWCIENVEGFELDNEAYDLYQKALGQ